MKKKVQNKRKFKFSRYKVIRNFIVIGIFVIVFFSVKTYAYTDKTIYKEITVSSGQTLWEIAKIEKESNEFYKNKDLREIVNSIKQTNKLTTSLIYENQVLKIIEY